MSFLKKILSVFTGKNAGAPAKQPAQKGAKNSPRPASDAKKPAGSRGAHDPQSRRPADNRPPRGDRPQPPRRQGEGARPHAQSEENRSYQGEGGNRPRHRDAQRPRREEGAAPENSNRPARPPRGDRPRHRPGGALSAEQVALNQTAHAAWSVDAYTVAPEEGKIRFADLNLPGEILHAVADLGFKYCTPIQAQSLASALAGKNVAGKAQTGTGKTAAFLIAILTRYLRSPEKRNQAPGAPRALVLAPTRELVIQICKDAETLGKYCGGIRSLAIYGGMDYERQRDDLSDEPVDLLVATPGRLLDFVRQRVVDLSQVDTLVIDEADRMLDMGFIPDVRAIVRRLPEKDQRCTMLYSATLDDTVMKLAAQWMDDPVRVEIESEGMTTDNIRQIVYIITAREKFTLLFNHTQRYGDARTIIFCNRKSTTERVAENLRRLGVPCETLSGDVSQAKRLQVLEHFRAGKIRTVVATDVAGRGIHVDDIAFVINYDFPYEPEDYVHRIGRTGRAGATGTAISFADEDESFTIPEIEAYIGEPLKCIQPEEALLAPLPALPARGDRRHHHPQQKPRPESEAAPAAAEPAAEPPAPEQEQPEPPRTIEVKPPSGSFPAPPAALPPEEEPAAPEAETAPEAPAAEAPAVVETAPVEEAPKAPRPPMPKPQPRLPRDRKAPQRTTSAKAPADGSRPSRGAKAPSARPPAAVPRRLQPPRPQQQQPQQEQPRNAAPVRFQPDGAKNDVWTPGE